MRQVITVSVSGWADQQQQNTTAGFSAGLTCLREYDATTTPDEAEELAAAYHP
jgi:hypothetical protein